jgi:uncharacterized delta-60 repeat protein
LDKTGKQKNRRAGGLLLIVLFVMGLAWPGLSAKAQAEVKEEWVRTFTIGQWRNNHANAVHVDKKGNVFVTGYPAIVKYSPGGRELWNRPVPSRASCMDGRGNLYTAGQYSNTGEYLGKYVISKYDNDGELIWQAYYEGPQQYWDSPVAIAVDRRGNVFVTGVSSVRCNMADIATVKYSPDGTLLWAARYHGSIKRLDIDCPRAMAVDRQGNVYVAGSFHYAGFDWRNYAIIKYSTEGEELWVRCYNGPGRGTHSPTALAVDKQGNVYVTGESRGAGTKVDYATVKYNSHGRLLWERRYDGPGSGFDRARAMAIDDLGNIFVTGVSYYDYPPYNDCATIKYSPDGETLWTRRFNGPVNGYDVANAITVDRWGNSYITGSSSSDYATVKYNPDGEELWTLYYSGIDNLFDYPTSIVVDNLGNIYVTGYITTDAWANYTITDYCTIKYRQHGRIPNSQY